MLSECNCLTQKVEVHVWKKRTHWYEGNSFFPLYMGSEIITIHANTIEELGIKKNEILSAFQKKYPDKTVQVWP